ncbi:unnamed protein product [Cuscuta epithymum]|uniref:CCHC-type domain-containing protein n=1 Tax=Cuscuta epithymum TaxID=186058 RepID=A0AAV0EL59_9ASTE|nr:unnamed protein product [Cuscuta epithymum]
MQMNSQVNFSSISANLNSIPVLNGTNFKEWKENILITLGCMDLDLALRVGQPASLTDGSTQDERRYYEKWDRSNRLSLMIIKRGIPESFRGAVSDEVTNAKDFLSEIEKRFVKSDKAEISMLLKDFTSKRYSGKGNIREYIMEMSYIVSRLKTLKIEISKDVLVHIVLNSLPIAFDSFKVSYNCQKEKWSLNELISYCVQEEERMKQNKIESAHLASTSKDKGKKRKRTPIKKEGAQGPLQKKHKESETTCFFCKKFGHMKKDCTKYHAWKVKKGLSEPPQAK